MVFVGGELVYFKLAEQLIIELITPVTLQRNTESCALSYTDTEESRTRDIRFQQLGSVRLFLELHSPG
jgi:hypothetical protein